MNITLKRLKKAAENIKLEWYEGNDSHSTSEYRGVCSGLDSLIFHFEEINNFTKWKKENKK